MQPDHLTRLILKRVGWSTKTGGRWSDDPFYAARSKAKKGNPAPTEPATTSSTFTITTKKGKEFQASLEPTSGCRKATNGEHTLYLPEGTTRDEGRLAFATHFSCPMTGIATEVVE